MKTVLIYRLGSLGDTVVALPCFHKIAERFPDCRRVVLTNEPVSKAAPRLRDVLQGSGLIHDTIEYRVGTRSLSDLARMRGDIARLNVDQAIYLAAPRGRLALHRDLAFFRLCGIRSVIGAPASSDLLTNRIDPATGEEEFECERLARCLADLGPIDLRSPASWDLRLTVAEREVADRALSPIRGERFIVFNMGGKQAHNDWGQANWNQLLAGLTQAIPQVPFAFIGAAQDAERADAIASATGHRGVNLCGKLVPRETAAVLGKAQLFAGHDSGPLHLAAACGVTCIGLFSPRTKPHKWHPFGDRHRVFRFDEARSPALVDPVRDAILEVVGGPGQIDLARERTA